MPAHRGAAVDPKEIEVWNEFQALFAYVFVL
jgi:hypothetical protein